VHAEELGRHLVRRAESCASKHVQEKNKKKRERLEKERENDEKSEQNSGDTAATHFVTRYFLGFAVLKFS